MPLFFVIGVHPNPESERCVAGRTTPCEKWWCASCKTVCGPCRCVRQTKRHVAHDIEKTEIRQR